MKNTNEYILFMFAELRHAIIYVQTERAEQCRAALAKYGKAHIDPYSAEACGIAE